MLDPAHPRSCVRACETNERKSGGGRLLLCVIRSPDRGIWKPETYPTLPYPSCGFAFGDHPFQAARQPIATSQLDRNHQKRRNLILGCQAWITPGRHSRNSLHSVPAWKHIQFGTLERSQCDVTHVLPSLQGRGRDKYSKAIRRSKSNPGHRRINLREASDERKQKRLRYCAALS